MIVEREAECVSLYSAKFKSHIGTDTPLWRFDCQVSIFHAESHAIVQTIANTCKGLVSQNGIRFGNFPTIKAMKLGRFKF